ncbi:CsoS2 family carboxysome shell protein [Thiomicrorhabdus sediminis]|uniref:Carboxysome shell peptide mid-region n=1 Tax=Thiomicrorhabdus sediminis TaxID=2580412 RepID=A0A4P9K3C5_9GAMM|nr:CsoS2 family carboxysome shell protein [Thiomicrorhabdus sediminis]QCU89362.1 hypothetical protein FE785_01300 [Thiomicrorhabdus sediminis]
MSGTTPTQSGREAARAHRQGMKRGKTARTSSPVSAKRRPEPVAPVASAPVAQPTAAKSPVTRPAVRVATAPVESASAAGRKAAKQKRQQLKSGKVSRTQSSTNPHPKAKARQDREPLVEVSERKPVATSTPTRPTDSKVAVKAEAKSSESSGRSMARAWRKAGAKGKAGQSAYKSKGTQSGALAKMANPDASTREIARKIRAERCSRGKAGCATAETASSKKSRQSKASRTAPEKVGESNTLSGQRVSGTQVGQGRKAMTGAETGACQLVSGTEYLGTEEFANNCDSTPNAKPAKVTQTQTTRGQTISGNEVGRSKSVTGDESGTCSAVSGTEYLPAEQSALFCGADAPKTSAKGAFSIMSQSPQSKPQANTGSKVTGGDNYKSQSVTLRPNSAPEKVVASKTGMGMTTTGTQVGRLENVTGSEKGVCKNVSGTGYQSAEEAQEYCDKPAEKPVAKVTKSGTAKGQTITGDRSGNVDKMTGAEAGACKPVSGTSYMGTEQLATCSAEQQQEAQQRMRQGINREISGQQPGLMGLTGAEAGACKLVSGTDYQANSQVEQFCDTANVAQPGQSDFPQMMAQPAVMQQATVMPQAQPAAAQGAKISGDAWDRGNKVTGVEEAWSNGNASAATNPMMGGVMSRPQPKAEPVQASDGRITGDAGETSSKITLTGGARA